VALAFAACANDLTLGLGFEAKGIDGGDIWSWMVLEVIVAVTAEPEQVVASFGASRIVTALGRGEAHEMSNVLLLKLDKDKEGREGALPFSLHFWLVTRVKATSSASGASIAISTSGKEVRAGTGL